MELELIRTYHLAGTNGKILLQNCLMMYSIELPWKDNHTRGSPVPISQLSHFTFPGLFQS